MLWQDGHHNYNGYHPISTFLPYNIQITSRHVFATLLSKPAQITKEKVNCKSLLGLYRPAERTIWMDHLDGPSGRTIWTDQLDKPASRTIVQATRLHSFNPPPLQIFSGPEILLEQNKFWTLNFSEPKCLAQKKFKSKKNFGRKKFWSEKNFSPESNFGPKKFWSEKKCWVQKKT